MKLPADKAGCAGFFPGCIGSFSLPFRFHFPLIVHHGKKRKMKNNKEVRMIPLKVNGRKYDVEVLPDTPLLWVIRENLRLTGTKYGCGRSLCGACTVHVNGEATRSCVTPVSSVAGKEITTIEGLSPDGSHPVQLAWIAEDVPQCGYCQSGQIMSAAALLAKNSKPSDSEIDDFMSGILCRCGTYQRIRRAIRRAGAMMGKG